MKLHLNTKEKIEEAKKFLDTIEPNGSFSFEAKKLPKTRTLPMNSALHVFKNQLAEVLNDAGLTVSHVLKQAVDIEWNGDLVLELLWRRLQVVITGKKSTTEPTVEEYQIIYNTLNRHLGTKFGIHVPFPSKKELKNKEVKR